MQLCGVIRMRLRFGGIGAALPFIEIGEPVLVGIFLERIGVFDWQDILFKPFVRHRRMHLRVVQRGWHAIGPDEMFFRDEKTRARTGLPLKGFLELLGSAIERRRDLGLGGSFRPKPWRRNKSITELDGAPPNGDRKRTRLNSSHVSES